LFWPVGDLLADLLDRGVQHGGRHRARIGKAHAAVAERTHVLLEEALRRRVMHVDRMRFGNRIFSSPSALSLLGGWRTETLEVEPYQSTLDDNRATVDLDLIAHAIEIVRIERSFGSISLMMIDCGTPQNGLNSTV
jgi:hypothetical protein